MNVVDFCMFQLMIFQMLKIYYFLQKTKIFENISTLFKKSSNKIVYIWIEPDDELIGYDFIEALELKKNGWVKWELSIEYSSKF